MSNSQREAKDIVGKAMRLALPMACLVLDQFLLCCADERQVTRHVQLNR